MHFTAKAKRLARVALAFAGMSALLAVMAGSYRTLDAEMEQMNAQLDAAHDEYYTESMRSTALYAQISQANDDAFIESVARREYKYTNPSEIHYTISNLPGANPTMNDAEVAVETQNMDAGASQ